MAQRPVDTSTAHPQGPPVGEGPIHPHAWRDLHATLGWRPLAVQTKRISGWLSRPSLLPPAAG